MTTLTMGAEPLILDVLINRDADFSVEIELEEVETGDPIDTEGQTLQLTIDDHVIEATPGESKFTFFQAAAVHEEWDDGKFPATLILTGDDDSTALWARGTGTIR